MRPLIRFGVKQAVLMNLVFIGVVGFATLMALRQMPVDRYPNFAFGEVTINVQWPGASPGDVERLVTKRIEDAIRGMDDLEFVRSTSLQGRSEVQVKFDDDTAYDQLYEELRLRVLAMQNQLPAVNGEPLQPHFDKVETDQWLPVVQVDLWAKDAQQPLAKRELTILARELQTRLEQQPGIKRVILWGDEAQQFVVALDAKRLRAAGLSVDQVHAALSTAGVALPAGRLPTQWGDRLLRIDGRFRSSEEVYGLPVRRDGDGALLTLGELIDQQASGIQRFDDSMIVTVNGRDSVSCRIIKDATADAREVKTNVLAELERFHHAHGDAGVASTLSQDTTIAINDSLDVLGWNIIQGVFLVMTVQALFLGLRSALLTISGLAFSVMGTLIWFWATGQSLNELSLLGFVIAVGILVDDEVVIIDNISRLRGEGRPVHEAVIEGTAQVFWPLVTASLVNIAGFLPLFLMSGIVGEFFSLIPQAVVVSLVLSLIEVVLMLPAHVIDFDRWFGPAKGITGEGLVPSPDQARGFMARVYARFSGLVDLTLRRPGWTLAMVGVLFLLAVGVLVQSAMAASWHQKPLVRLEFFPSDASAAEVRVTLPEGATLADTDRTVREISAFLAGKGEHQIRSAAAFAGMQVDTTYKPQWGQQYGFIMAEIAGREQRDFADPNHFISTIDRELRERFAHDGVRVETIPVQGGPPTGRPISVRLGGLDASAVEAATAAMKTWMLKESGPGGTLPGVIDLNDDAEHRATVISFVPDRRRLAEHGINEAEAQRFVATLREGLYVGEFRRSDEDIPIRIRLSNVGESLAELGEVPLRALPGGDLHWSDIGSLRIDDEPSQIIRRDFVRTITISGGLADDAAISAIGAAGVIREWFDHETTNFPGVVLAFGGEAESTGRSYASLGAAFLVAVLLIYALLAMQFGGWLQPLLLMSNILFSFTGVVLVMGTFGGFAMLLGPAVVRPERALITVNTFIAFIALTGMVVNNAIVLLDVINQLRSEGVALGQAMRRGALLRLRAIVLTAITTLVGLLPTAIGIPDFSLTWSPMAMAFCSGLTMSTILTLLVVPVLYELLERHERLVGWCFAGIVLCAAGGLAVLAYRGV